MCRPQDQIIPTYHPCSADAEKTQDLEPDKYVNIGQILHNNFTIPGITQLGCNTAQNIKTFCILVHIFRQLFSQL